MMYAIKVKALGEKRWSFLTPRGGSIHLKVHAALFDSPEKAQRTIDDNAANNPSVEWKIVEI